MTCYICDRPVNWNTSDPLHSTNWELPNKRTFDVCSTECQSIVLDNYEIEKRIARRKSVARTDQIREIVVTIYTIAEQRGHPDLQNEAEIWSTYRAMESVLEEDD